MVKPKIDALIVDDDKEICSIIRQYLEDLRFFRLIVEANDGIVATQKLQNQTFGLVILDMDIPKKNGFDLLKEFENNSLNNKECILVLSGTLSTDLIARLLQRGVKNFLVKPSDEESFKEKVKNMLS